MWLVLCMFVQKWRCNELCILCVTCSLLWPFSANRSPEVQKSLSFVLKKSFLALFDCAHSKNTSIFNLPATLLSTPIVLFSCTPFDTKSYIYIYVWLLCNVPLHTISTPLELRELVPLNWAKHSQPCESPLVWHAGQQIINKCTPNCSNVSRRAPSAVKLGLCRI